MPGGETPRTLSIVIPCYNEEASLPELCRRVEAVAERCFPQAYELVLINDGSKDGTWREICGAAERNPAIVGLNLSRNYGHQVALTSGLQACGGDCILVIDADLQDPPELLPEMLEVLDQGADVVYGQRSERKGETRFKLMTASLFYRFIASVVDVPIPKDTGDFRLMSRRALEAFNCLPEQHRFIRGMVSWIGFKQVAFPYVRDPRLAGETNYPFSKMIALAFDAITGFSTRPLRLAAYMAVMFGLLAVLVAIYAVFRWTTGSTVAGWTSLFLIVLVLGAVQLATMAIIGEYVGRMFVEVKRRPLYFLSDQVGDLDRLRRSGTPLTARPEPELTPSS